MVRHASLLAAPVGLTPAVAGCNVSPTAPETTGGVDASTDVGVTCDKREVILLTDFTSTKLTLTTPDGMPTSPSFLSSASTMASDDADALSGDVVLPSMRPLSRDVVLIDQSGSGIITWADPATAKVLHQLPIGTGFDSNPYDYVEIDASTAYVSRRAGNAAPGRQPFDSGSDVLVIDPVSQKITGSVPMPVTDGLPPCPAGVAEVRDTTLVVLQNVSTDFTTVADSVLVGITGGAVSWRQTVTGLKGCYRTAISPSDDQMALGGTTSNQAFLLDTTTGKATVLLTASVDSSGKGKGLVHGDFLCSPGCGRVCLLADADDGKRHRWSIGAPGLDAPGALEMAPSVGLPPVSIGAS